MFQTAGGQILNYSYKYQYFISGQYNPPFVQIGTLSKIIQWSSKVKNKFIFYIFADQLSTELTKHMLPYSNELISVSLCMQPIIFTWKATNWNTFINSWKTSREGLINPGLMIFREDYNVFLELHFQIYIHSIKTAMSIYNSCKFLVAL